MITGRIYCLKSFQTSDVYIGSTILTLKKRLVHHKSDYKRFTEGKYHYISSIEITKYADCYIELIKEVVCDKKQLLILEGEEMTKHLKCINKQHAGNQVKYENKHLYNIARMKEQYIKNPDRNKNYYLNNKEKILENQNILYCCECGATLRNGGKAPHNKTKKHLKYLSSLVH